MTFVYLVCFLLLSFAIVLLLGLTPEKVTEDILRFVTPKKSLRVKVLMAKGKKKPRRIMSELERIRSALNTTGKGARFTVLLAASLVMMLVGCVAAIAIDNPYLVPVFAVSFALVPFFYAKRTVNYYNKHIREELETALSIITTSYIRSDDIIGAVSENIRYLKPPVRDIFDSFVAENKLITSNIKQSIKNLKDKINNTVFAEWCDTLLVCQEDRTLKDTLMPVVAKLTDIRIANNEIRGLLSAARTEYFVMAGMVAGNIPLLFFLNKDWYGALMNTTPGKLVLALCASVILVTFLLMLKWTKPVEYRK